MKIHNTSTKKNELTPTNDELILIALPNEYLCYLRLSVRRVGLIKQFIIR